MSGNAAPQECFGTPVFRIKGGRSFGQMRPRFGRESYFFVVKNEDKYCGIEKIVVPLQPQSREKATRQNRMVR